MTEYATAEAQRTSAFGDGGQRPYEHALSSGQGVLRLREAAGIEAASTSIIDVARFTASADEVDLSVIARCDGPMIDLGCGPGRMVRAAMGAGRLALGVDVSESAVALARADGIPVLHRSLFDWLPAEGMWGQVLLLDGNLGIGGDVMRLISRAASLVHAAGTVVVETHPQRAHDRRFDAVLVNERGATSDPFPWAEMGARALTAQARQAGLLVVDEWSLHGRTFVEIAKTRRRLPAA